MTDFAHMRRMMVDGQIRTQDVTDLRLLSALLEIPREKFVPADLQSLSYLDRDLAIGTVSEPKRFLLKPAVLARLIQAAEIEETDRVLDVGCLTGYGTAILARLAHTVVALEENEELASRAEQTLRALGLSAASVHRGALVDGLRSQGPYDAILIEGTIEVLPDAIQSQLKDGGRIICIQRDTRGPVCRAMLYRASAGDVSGAAIFDASGPPLPGFAHPPAFVF